jgi:hypothetical protein
VAIPTLVSAVGAVVVMKMLEISRSFLHNSKVERVSEVKEVWVSFKLKLSRSLLWG